MTAIAAETAARRRYAPRRLVSRSWPVYLFFAFLPFAWFLGLANLALPVYGVLLFFGLLVRGGVRLPARFGLWLLFLVWVVVSALELDNTDRALAYAYRTSLYFTATALFIYIFTSTPRELPTRTVVKALALYWGAVVIGGFLGMAFPSVSLPSFAQAVLAPLLPGDIASVGFVQDITTPGFADVQRILGFPVGRPTTFFNYTNEWASTLVLLTPFAILAMRIFGGRWRRVVGALLVLSVVPLVVSLSRGAWIALVVLVVYASVRFAMQGNVRALKRVTVAVAVAAVVILVTPLAGLIESRLEHGHSDEGRVARDVAALGLVQESPLSGYGAPQPGGDGAAVGTHGQLFLLLVSHGVPGFVLFFGWFLYSLVRTGTGGSSVRFWCHVVILVFLVMTPFYELSAFQLMVVAAAMALAWREIAGSPAPSSGGDDVVHAVPRATTAVPIAIARKRAAVGAGSHRERGSGTRPRSRRGPPPRRGAAERPPPPSAPTIDAHRIDLSALARGGALGLAGGLLFAVFGFLLVLVISHGLGATGAGAFFEAVALFMILTRVAQIGADVGVVRMLPRLLALGRFGEIRRTISIALGPVALVGTGLAGALYLLAPEISRVVVNGTPPESLVFYIRVWAPFLVLAALTAVVLAAARGLGSLLPFVSVENVGKPAVQALLALAVIAVGLGTTAVALAWAIPVAIGCAAAALWLSVLVARVAPERVSQRSVAAVANEFWRFASPRAVAAFFQATAAWVDVILVGALASVKAAGIYAATSRLVFMGIVFLRALILVLGPQISALLARNLRDRAQIVYQVSTWWLTVLSWPVYILLAVFAPLALSVFGQEFAAGDKALVVLALAMLVSMACGPVSVVLLMAGKSSWNLFNTIFAAALGVGLNLLLIPRYGIVGAAIAAAATITANNLIPLVQVWGFLRLHPLGSGFLIVAGSALLTYGGIGMLGRLLLGPTLVGLVASGGLATIAYAVLLWSARDTLKFDVIRHVVSRAERRLSSRPGDSGVVTS
jgi:O-antigen/teichoic acid export membrane protein